MSVHIEKIVAFVRRGPKTRKQVEDHLHTGSGRWSATQWKTVEADERIAVSGAGGVKDPKMLSYVDPEEEPEEEEPLSLIHI